MNIQEEETYHGEEELPSVDSKPYRSSASFGKRQEYIAVAELSRRDQDVYMTLVDDQQIDCIIRQEKDGQLRYLDIQVKARSNDAKIPGTFSALEIRKPREDFFSSSILNKRIPIGLCRLWNWLMKPIETKKGKTKENTALFLLTRSKMAFGQDHASRSMKMHFICQIGIKYQDKFWEK